MTLTGKNNPALRGDPVDAAMGKSRTPPDGVLASARFQRGTMTDEQWRNHLLEMARTFEGILNGLVEAEGPKGLRFTVGWEEGSGA